MSGLPVTLNIQAYIEGTQVWYHFWTDRGVEYHMTLAQFKRYVLNLPRHYEELTHILRFADNQLVSLSGEALNFYRGRCLSLLAEGSGLQSHLNYMA